MGWTHLKLYKLVDNIDMGPSFIKEKANQIRIKSERKTVPTASIMIFSISFWVKHRFRLGDSNYRYDNAEKGVFQIIPM